MTLMLILMVLALLVAAVPGAYMVITAERAIRRLNLPNRKVQRAAV
jgi:hypothetical protein